MSEPDIYFTLRPMEGVIVDLGRGLYSYTLTAGELAGRTVTIGVAGGGPSRRSQQSSRECTGVSV